MNRKDELNQIILKNDYYDMSIYKVINSGVLDEIIKKINNEDVPCDVNPNEITSSNEQFLGLLNRFVIFFKKNFCGLSEYTDESIKELIQSNINEFSNYLLSKHYLGDNKYIRFFEESLNRLAISNFVKNTEYSYELKKLFKDENIKIKNIDKYTFNEVMKISDLLSDLVFCYYNEFHTLLLFTDINKFMSEYIDVQSKNEAKMINALINDFDFKCSFIIESYNKKREYLKYFKNIS
jgi:hypothetical protein